MTWLAGIRRFQILKSNKLKIMELVGNVKTYDWGKLGRESEVAKLAALHSSNFTPDDTTPYSELWMGDHTSGPSKIKSTQEDLGRFLAANGTELLGGQDKLTFLFKVLSIGKALSIQVHPNKQEAERLHAERPDVYKDPNHKPELAIALTPFLALCGFRPYQEIYELCSKLPPLVNLLGADNVAKITSGADGLRTCYEILMTSPEKSTADCIEEISKNYSSILQENGLLEIFNKINNDFPRDVGLLSLFFLNLIRLKPGEAIFLGANEIHAYLEGDCIECMACSDNVVRAGLTPKYKDVSCLIQMLNYEGLPAESKLFRPQQIDSCLERFSPPVKDFAVEKLSIPKSMKEYKLNMEKYGAILLVLRGERQLQFADGGGLPVKRGSIVFIPGNVGEVISFVGMHNEDDFVGYIAKYNSF